MSSRRDAPRLSIRDLRRSFGPRTVLDGIDLDVDPGSVLLLTGRNGSGKTTLLRCIAGLSAFDGAMTLDGEPWDSRRAGRERLGYLPQTLGLPEWATVDEVLALFARLRHVASDSLGLPEDFLPPRDQRIEALSGGQRQRVAMAVALLGQPSLLLLDEPTANLDDDGRDAVCELLAEQRDRGVSVLVAAPSALDLNGLPDRTVHLRDGRVAAGPREDAAHRPSPPPTILQEVAS